MFSDIFGSSRETYGYAAARLLRCLDFLNTYRRHSREEYWSRSGEAQLLRKSMGKPKRLGNFNCRCNFKVTYLEQSTETSPRRVAFYGGSFDPPHDGHIEIARVIIEQFSLHEFVFIPAFHAPHKVRLTPTSAYDRYAMLCLITAETGEMSVSKMEIEMPDRPYSIETLTRINSERPGDEIFFVMGADSWMDITTWREWENVLSISDHIVITRPGYEISVDHVTSQIRNRIIDLRDSSQILEPSDVKNIYLTDCVNLDISATQVRSKIRGGDASWKQEVPAEVAIYVEKYQIYS